MSIVTELQRIATAADKIKSKIQSWGENPLTEVDGKFPGQIDEAADYIYSKEPQNTFAITNKTFTLSNATVLKAGCVISIGSSGLGSLETNLSASKTAKVTVGTPTYNNTNYTIPITTESGEASCRHTVNTGWIDGKTETKTTSVGVTAPTEITLPTYVVPDTIPADNTYQTNGKMCVGNITLPEVNRVYVGTAVPADGDYQNGDVYIKLV